MVAESPWNFPKAMPPRTHEPVAANSSSMSLMQSIATTSVDALFRVSGLLCRSTAPRATLPQVLRVLCEHSQAALGQISFLTEDGSALEVAASYAADGSPRPAGINNSRAARWIAEREQPLHMPLLVGDDDRFVGKNPSYDSSMPFVGVPIRTAAGAVAGVLEIQPSLSEEAFDAFARLCEMCAALVGQHGAARWPSSDGARQAAVASTGTHYGFENLVGHTPAMRRVFAQVRQVAKWNTTVLIMGESGTGKELIAHAIHYSSQRSRGPFIKLNCAALPDNLLESELFGHEKGAFTGAVARHSGRFEQAHRGTLFLDEIGEISPSFQAKLLRVLQEGEFERLGGTQTLRADVRIIAATNKDLEQQVEVNKFRQDLFYRLNVMPILTPPLRDRREDIGDLAVHLVKKLAGVQQRELSITEDAIRLLKSAEWPGNVRELENCLERAAIMSGAGLINDEAVTMAGVSSELTTHSASVNQPSTIDLRDPNIDERERVMAALERAGWVQAKAARLLGMTPRQVAYRIQILKIDVPRF